eukprot:1479627-Amphidinium_carterae.1
MMGTQDISTIDISSVFHIKSIWGSTLPSPFLPTPSSWLASHVLDYSLISSNIWVYVNSILELSAHPTIRSKLTYFAHNIFSKSISNLLINPATGEWYEYRGININLQNNSHQAIKFRMAASEASGSSSDSEGEPSAKKIKPAAAANDSHQQGTIMHFNKGSAVTININQGGMTSRPLYKSIDIKDSKVSTTTKPEAITELSAATATSAAATASTAAAETSD